jgi:hypothetical protein
MDMRYGQFRIILYIGSLDIFAVFFSYIVYTELNVIMTITDELVRICGEGKLSSYILSVYPSISLAGLKKKKNILCRITNL